MLPFSRRCSAHCGWYYRACPSGYASLCRYHLCKTPYLSSSSSIPCGRRGDFYAWVDMKWPFSLLARITCQQPTISQHLKCVSIPALLFLPLFWDSPKVGTAGQATPPRSPFAWIPMDVPLSLTPDGFASIFVAVAVSKQLSCFNCRCRRAQPSKEENDASITSTVVSVAESKWKLWRR